MQGVYHAGRDQTCGKKWEKMKKEKPQGCESCGFGLVMTGIDILSSLVSLATTPMNIKDVKKS